MRAVALCGKFPLNETHWPTLPNLTSTEGSSADRGYHAAGAPMYSIPRCVHVPRVVSCHVAISSPGQQAGQAVPRPVKLPMPSSMQPISLPRAIGRET
jgi:hypothetical protein